MGEIEELIARVEGASGPDQEIDAAIACIFAPSYRELLPHWSPEQRQMMIPAYTSSLDAIVALIEEKLPGWMWRVATCSVSDDAWVAPDFNHPELGDHYLQYLSPADGSDPTEWWLEVTDVDRRPPGQPALALCAAFLKALGALQQKEAGR